MDDTDRDLSPDQIGVATDCVRVRILPGGRMSREDAAMYLGRRPKTLAAWALEGKGPTVHKCGGRCFYFQDDLDAFIEGKEEMK